MTPVTPGDAPPTPLPPPPAPRRRRRLTRLRRWLHVVIVPFALAAAFAPAEPKVVLAVGVPLAVLVGVWLDRFASPRAREALEASRALRFADVALWNLALVLLLLEPALLVASKVIKSPLLTPPNAKSRERITAYRYAPGAAYLGGHVNSGGFHDTEWVQPKPADCFRIVALGDSFNVGIVPYDQNVLTLLELELTRRCGARVEVANLGVASLSPIDYLHLLNDEGRLLEPDLVLTCVFVGNDIGAVHGGSLARPANWLTFALATRLFRLATARVEPAQAGARVEQKAGQPMTPERYLEHVGKDYLPTLSAAATPSLDRRWTNTLEVLDQITAIAGGRHAVVLYPCEAQVDPELLAQACKAEQVDPSTIDLTGPGRRCTAHFAAAGVPFCDLQPAFVAQREQGRAYEPYDSHWNRLGNQIAADALADWLEPLVRERLAR